MREAGLSEEDIAARFFITPTVVRQRLRLASVSPRLLDLYAEGVLVLEQLMAFAVKAVLGGATWQRCQFHLAQNAIHHAPTLAIRKRIGAELRAVWNARYLKAAEAELAALVESYRKTAPKLADWLEKNVPEGLAVFTLDEDHRRRMRTSNPIERAIQQEIKRRTRKVRVFPNEDALLRLVTAVLAEIDDKWATSTRAYLAMGAADG